MVSKLARLPARLFEFRLHLRLVLSPHLLKLVHLVAQFVDGHVFLLQQTINLGFKRRFGVVELLLRRASRRVRRRRLCAKHLALLLKLARGDGELILLTLHALLILSQHLDLDDLFAFPRLGASRLLSLRLQFRLERAKRVVARALGRLFTFSRHRRHHLRSQRSRLLHLRHRLSPPLRLDQRLDARGEIKSAKPNRAPVSHRQRHAGFAPIALHPHARDLTVRNLQRDRFRRVRSSSLLRRREQHAIALTRIRRRLAIKTHVPAGDCQIPGATRHRTAEMRAIRLHERLRGR